MTVYEDRNETVDAGTRERMLDEYGHQCQGCGRKGPGAGGRAILHVHHLKRDPDDCGVHDPENLTLYCRQCHVWQHQRPTGEDAPARVTLSEADHQKLLAKDIEILAVLANEGPARTGEIADALTAEPSVMATRERLWTLMGLDNIVDERETQLVDQDADTGEWGLAGQIERSARGHIPDDPQVLLQRITDEQVRQALDRGCSRRVVVDAFGIARRTSFYKQKRARAYDFPLEAFDNSELPGERAAGAAGGEDGSVSASVPAGQQRLDALGKEASEAEGASDERSGLPEPVDGSGDAGQHDAGSRQARESEVGADGAGSEALRVHLQQALSALREVENAL